MPRWIRNRSIATKIVGIAMLVASVSAGIAVYGLVNLRGVAAQQDVQYRRDIVAMQHMVAVRSAVGLQMEAVQSHLLSQPGFYRDRYEATIADTDRQIDVGAVVAAGVAALAARQLSRPLRRAVAVLTAVAGATSSSTSASTPRTRWGS